MTTITEFIKQVRQEGAKVTWPTRKETGVSLLMVVIMVALMGMFFTGADLGIARIIKFILGV